MARAKYQILVIPYFIENEVAKYCVFKRKDVGIWQFIAGGGEDEDASVLESAKREAYEEADIERSSQYISLETVCSIPANCFNNYEKIWGNNCFVIPEYCFGVLLDEKQLSISHEHTEYEWLEYNDALSRLNYDSNKTALWELSNRIKSNTENK